MTTNQKVIEYLLKRVEQLECEYSKLHEEYTRIVLEKAFSNRTILMPKEENKK